MSLAVPTTSVFKSTSLPGSSASVNEEHEVRLQFQGIEVKINKNENQPQDEKAFTKKLECGQESIDRIDTKEDAKDSIMSLGEVQTNVKNYKEEKTSVTSYSSQERKKGVSIVSNGPMPSLEAH